MPRTRNGWENEIWVVKSIRIKAYLRASTAATSTAATSTAASSSAGALPHSVEVHAIVCTSRAAPICAAVSTSPATAATTTSTA